MRTLVPWGREKDYPGHDRVERLIKVFPGATSGQPQEVKYKHSMIINIHQIMLHQCLNLGCFGRIYHYHYNVDSFIKLIYSHVLKLSQVLKCVSVGATICLQHEENNAFGSIVYVDIPELLSHNFLIAAEVSIQ